MVIKILWDVSEYVPIFSKSGVIKLNIWTCSSLPSQGSAARPWGQWQFEILVSFDEETHSFLRKSGNDPQEGNELRRVNCKPSPNISINDWFKSPPQMLGFWLWLYHSSIWSPPITVIYFSAQLAQLVSTLWQSSLATTSFFPRQLLILWNCPIFKAPSKPRFNPKPISMILWPSWLYGLGFPNPKYTAEPAEHLTPA